MDEQLLIGDVTYTEFLNLKTHEIVKIKALKKGFYLHNGINVLKAETLRAIGLVPATDTLKVSLGLTVKK